MGNKSDMVDKREVTTSEGQELAGKYKCLFLEVIMLFDFSKQFFRQAPRQELMSWKPSMDLLER